MIDRLTVLVLHPSNEMYGADRSLHSLVRAIADVARPLVVLPNDLPYRGQLSAALATEGVTVVIGPLPVLRRRYLRRSGLARWAIASLRGWLWLVRLARREKAVGIISNTSGIIVGVMVAATIRRPHLWYLREIVDRPKWFRVMLRAAARLASGRIVVVSEAVAAWLGPVTGRGPAVLYNGVDIPGAVTPLPERPTAVFVGRLNEWKGHDLFVTAATVSHLARPDASYKIIGGPVPGETRIVDDLLARIHNVDPGGSYLEWVGEVPDARSAMRDAWIVVVPSLKPDPFPNVVLESMSEGRAVVGSSAGGIAEMVVDGATGILCQPGDEAALAAGMTKLLGDRELAKRYGSAGRSLARECFSRDRFVEDWRNLFGDWISHTGIEPSSAQAGGPRPHAVDWDEGKISRYWDFVSTHGTADYFSSVYSKDLADEIIMLARPRGIVVDLGCGVGDLLVELHSRGLNVRGVDSSPASIAVARNRLPGDPGQLKVGSLTALPLPDASVDTAVLVEVVEHVLDRDLETMLREVRRVVRPGGRVFLSTPNDEDLRRERVDCSTCGASFHRIQHVRRWTSESIVAFLESGGFDQAEAFQRRLVGDTRLNSKWHRRMATLRDRQVMCPDCGTTFRRPFRLGNLAPRGALTAWPHLLAVATRP